MKNFSGIKRGLKRIAAGAGAIALSLALLATGAGGVRDAVNAAVSAVPPQATVSANGFVSEYELGDSVDLPTCAATGNNALARTIKSSDGKIFEEAGKAKDPYKDAVYFPNISGDAAGNVFKPPFAGHYTVDFKSASALAAGQYATARTFRFEVKARGYSIEVEAKGADIPTFVKTSASGSVSSFELPKARLIYTDTRGKVRVAEDAENDKIEIEVTGAGYKGDRIFSMTGERKVTVGEDTGKYFIKYYFAHAGAYIQKEFTVTADKTLETPAGDVNLDIGSVPDTGKLFTKVSLPTATAVDKSNRDANVKITVEVTAPDESKNVYTVGEDTMLDPDSGFILDKYKNTDADDYYVNEVNLVRFDNDRETVFYPHTLGADDATTAKYIVRYTATTDDGRSVSKEYPINVSRAERPKIKINSSEIPSEWANSRRTALAPDATEWSTNGKFALPQNGASQTTIEYVAGATTETANPKDSANNTFTGLNADNAMFDLYMPKLRTDDPSNETFISNCVPANDFKNENVYASFKRPGGTTQKIFNAPAKPVSDDYDDEAALAKAVEDWQTGIKNWKATFEKDYSKTDLFGGAWPGVTDDEITDYETLRDALYGKFNRVKTTGFKVWDATASGGSGAWTEEKKEYWVIPLDLLKTLGDYDVQYYVNAGTVEYSTTISYFTVTVKSEVIDKAAPYITLDNAPKNVKSGAAFTAPAVKVSDDKGVVRSETRYYLYSGAFATGTRKAEIGKDSFYNGKIEKFDASNLKDRDGAAIGDAVIGASDRVVIYTLAFDAAGNYRENVAEVKIANTTAAGTPVIQSIKANNAELDAGTNRYQLASGGNGKFYGTYDVDEWFKIDEIIASTALEDDYLGFDIFVRKPNSNGEGALVGDTEVTFWVDKNNFSNSYSTAKRVLHIENFRFKPSSSAGGLYTISINIFGANGNTSALTLFANIPSGGGSTQTTAGGLPASTEFGNAVNLPNKVYNRYDNDGKSFAPEDINPTAVASANNYFGDAVPYFDNTAYVFRTTVYGPHFSVSGRELSAYSEGEYTVQMEPRRVVGTSTSAKGVAPSDLKYLPTKSVDNFKCEGVSDPILKLSNVVPAVSTNWRRPVAIPGVLASSPAGIAKSEVKVSGPSSPETYEIGESDELYGKEPADKTTETGSKWQADKVGWRKFTPTKAGKYTVTYTVTDNTGKTATQTYTVDVGDVYLPEIVLDEKESNGTKKEYKSQMKVGEKFQFIKVKATDKYFKDQTNPWEEAELADEPKDVTGDVYMKLKLNGDAKFSNSRGGTVIPSNDWEFDTPGAYTVEYTVTDAAGNEGIKTYPITVTEKTKGSTVGDRVLAVIFSVLGVVVIGGLVFYFVGLKRRNGRLAAAK